MAKENEVALETIFLKVEEKLIRCINKINKMYQQRNFKKN